MGAPATATPELQPIYLSTGIENPNGAAARFFVEGAEIAGALADPAASYQRAINLFDGNSEDEVFRPASNGRS